MNVISPIQEAERLDALRKYAVLDTPSEQLFDDLTLLASHICQTPIALISLVDENRQWFKSRMGIEVLETPRDVSFCSHTISNQGEILEVRDAQLDPRFSTIPLVTQAPCIRFYAGAPLLSPDGKALGALCVMDTTPRVLTREQVVALQALSRQVVTQMELRRQTRLLVDDSSQQIRSEKLLRQQFDELSVNSGEADRLLALAEKSRRALLSVLEDEKRVVQNLRASEERFRQLAENIHEVFWITDPTKKEMVYISPAYEKIWWRTCEDLYKFPQTWLEAIHAEDRERVRVAATSKQETGEYDEIYRIVRPDRSIRWIHDRAFPIRNSQGQVYRVVGTAEDITLKRDLEDQFRQAQKMESIGQLAGGVAHDFNNLLTVINCYSQMLLESPEMSCESVEMLKEVYAAGERAANLTRQLLTFSRKQAIRTEAIDMNEVVTDVSQMLRRLIGENIELQLNTAPGLPLIAADAGMMDQVLMNLAVNARDAMPRGGRLTIQTNCETIHEQMPQRNAEARVGNFLCLSVKDSGCGMSSEVLQRIFEPFFTTKEPGKGTGLGLATVFGIVKQHNGWMEVESEVGFGTIFKVFLPALLQAPSQTGEVTAIQPKGGKETILLVEDEAAVRSMALVILRKYGYRVLEASSGPEALGIWKANSGTIDLLLTDMVMPGGMTGNELADKLKTIKPTLKAIYTSGYSAEMNKDVFELRDKTPFIQKPYHPQKLAEAVRSCLDGK